MSDQDPRRRESLHRRRVGVLDDGALADVSPGGWVHTLDGAAHIGWAVDAEDRWHLPEGDVSARSDSVDSTPVIETRLRIPGGEAIARVYGALVGDDADAAVIVDVGNDSATPVALAAIVRAAQKMSVTADSVSLGGRTLVTLTRPAGRFAVAADLDALHRLLEAGDFDSRPPSSPVSGVVALVAPLPHTAHAVWAVDSVPARIDRDLVPAPERVVAGWEAVERRGIALDLREGHLHTTFRSTAADLRLGPDEPDPTTLCRVAAARSMIGDPTGGWNDVVATAELARGNGRIGGKAGGLERTRSFLDAVVAAVSAGLEVGVLVDDELMLGALAGAANWLSSRRRSFEAEADRVATYRSVSAVPRILRLVDQPAAAAHLLSVSGRSFDGVVVDAPRRWRDLEAERSDRGGWSDTGPPPSTAAGARFVEAVVDGVARTVPDPTAEAVAIDVLGGWSSTDRGRAVEAHRVPTIAGEVSLAMRWHDERPALLWECRPWSDRPAVQVRWTASRLDPEWRGSGESGEALLSSPSDDAD